MKKFIVDRIEGEKAVLECENKDTAVFDITSLPKGIKEGDVLVFEAGSCYLNEEEAQKRKEKIRALMSSLFEED